MQNRNASYSDDDNLRVDDMADDVAAAYQEVRDRTEGGETEQPDPVPAQVRTEGTEGREDDGAPDSRTQEQKDRDERGRFKARTDKDGKDATKQPETETPATDQPDGTEAIAAAGPPPSWGVKAKAAWETIPADVRAEIAKRESEVGQGLRALADYKDLKPYAEIARSRGTTVKAALDHYVAIDRLMGQDLAGGLATAAEAYGLPKDKLGQVFAGLAQKYGAQVQTPTNGQQDGQMSEDDALMQIFAPVLAPIKAQLEQLSQSHTSRAEQDRNSQVQSIAQAITTFANDSKNIYFANVEADIQRLFERGMVPASGNAAADLQTAYDLAVRMNPEIQEALIEKRIAEAQGTQRQKELKATDKARNASRSMGGSRVPGTVIQDRQATSGPDDIEADVRAAYRQHAQA